MHGNQRNLKSAASDDLTSATETRTETSVVIGTREEDNCKIVEAELFQRHGNEQRCQIQHLANGEETAGAAVLAWACKTAVEEY